MKTKLPKELSLLVGIVAAFVFLLAFFVGAGVPTKTILGTGIFFFIVSAALTLLLLSRAKAH